jgi:hypothetical protein
VCVVRKRGALASLGLEGFSLWEHSTPPEMDVCNTHFTTFGVSLPSTTPSCPVTLRLALPILTPTPSLFSQIYLLDKSQKCTRQASLPGQKISNIMQNTKSSRERSKRSKAYVLAPQHDHNADASHNQPQDNDKLHFKVLQARKNIQRMKFERS